MKRACEALILHIHRYESTAVASFMFISAPELSCSATSQDAIDPLFENNPHLKVL